MSNRYALIENNVVVNVCLWDGHLHTWQPPEHLDAVLAPDEIAIGWRWDGSEWLPPVPPPLPVPEVISDRQFFQQLAIMNVITQDEAVAAVATGTIPPAMATLIDALPADEQFDARMKLCGAVEFHRSEPLVETLGGAIGWTDEQIDDLWRAAAQL